MAIADNQTQTRSHRATIEKSSAFTLVELMISVAIISLLAGMAAQTFGVVLDARDIAMTRMEISETGRTTLDFMASEIRSSYLTPDSVKPYYGQNNETAPRFRFAGISRDLSVDDYPDVPGAGKDDDGDGLEDEEFLDGVDGDNNGKDNDGEIDEDIGGFPSDILHFVSAIESSGDLILQEISYGLDPSGTRLVRRAAVLNMNSNSAQKKLADFGQFVDDLSNKRLLPPPVVPGRNISAAAVRNAMENWDIGSKYGQLQAQTPNYSNQNPAKLFQVMAYDIRGLRLRYWYYDYNRGGWRVAQEWDSAREMALVEPRLALFNKPAANNSSEGRTRVGFANIIVNEPDDMYPRTQGSPGSFLLTSPASILKGITGGEYEPLYQRIMQRTDGLPDMVEITIYVQDRKREYNPRPFSARVFVPNNYRSVGA